MFREDNYASMNHVVDAYSLALLALLATCVVSQKGGGGVGDDAVRGFAADLNTMFVQAHKNRRVQQLDGSLVHVVGRRQCKLTLA